MDFKVNREILTTNEVAFDGIQEQSVELDYILPDYFPDIFKLIKCQLQPKITSSSVLNDKITYELVVGIKVLYCSEQSSAVECVCQKMNYSKTIDLGKSCENPIVTLVPKVDYINCRVVNQRRLDLRGAISTKIKATCEQKQEVICNAFGMNIEMKKTPISYAGRKLHATKMLDINEEFDLGYSKPSVVNIVNCSAIVKSIDKKVITNKMVVKGDTQINMLYSCKKDNADSLEAMQFVLPFSQIVDLEGLDEQFECIVDVAAISCEMSPKENSDGDYKILECDLILKISCVAVKSSSAECVTDAYSTAFPCECKCCDFKVEMMPKQFSETYMGKSSMSYPDGEISCVHDLWCKVDKLSAKSLAEKGQICVMGSILYSAITTDCTGKCVMLENEVPFEHYFEACSLTDMAVIDVTGDVCSASYNLVSVNTVDVKCEIRLCGTINETVNQRGVSEIIIDEKNTKQRDGDYALKLYFADAGEDVWEIAKKYSTSAAAIMEENELEEEKISQQKMILIPIVV